MHALNFLLLLVYVVCGVSIYEYVVHRFISHGEENITTYIPKTIPKYIGISSVSSSHSKHHEAKDPPFGFMEKNQDKCDLLISTAESIKLYIGGIISLGGIGMLLKMNPEHLFISLTLAMIYVLATWNTFHTLTHGALHQNYDNCSYVIPPLPMFESHHPFRNTMVEYHKVHHQSNGTKNFNTTIPYIGDVLFRTCI